MKTKSNNIQLNPTAISQPNIKKTKSGLYHLPRAVTKQELYNSVIEILKEDYCRKQLSSTIEAKRYLQLKLSQYQREVFICVFLDTQHGVIAIEEMFYGTIDAAPVYCREVVKRALENNSGALLFAHNHPSGSNSSPSIADKEITKRLIAALNLVDIRVIDHIIFSGIDSFSFAENGLI